MRRTIELDVIIEPLRSLDWNDIDAVAAVTRKTLAVLAEDGTQVRRTLRKPLALRR